MSNCSQSKTRTYKSRKKKCREKKLVALTGKAGEKTPITSVLRHCLVTPGPHRPLENWRGETSIGRPWRELRNKEDNILPEKKIFLLWMFLSYLDFCFCFLVVLFCFSREKTWCWFCIFSISNFSPLYLFYEAPARLRRCTNTHTHTLWKKKTKKPTQL